MNDLYKKFVEKASETIPNEIPSFEYGLALFNKNFAELIIRECIEQIGEFTGEQEVGKIFLEDGSSGLTYNVVSAEEILKQHFGIQ